MGLQARIDPLDFGQMRRDARLMPRESSKRINRLTIYMVKPKFQRLIDIIDSASAPRQVAGIGQFVSEESHPRPPARITNFFGPRWEMI
jgi:hypothetical protein